MQSAEVDFASINKAFSNQSYHFDEDDRGNSILQDLRKQVYSHVDRFLPVQSKILELNAGTGIDALHFVVGGHTIHAIDLSDGMIQQLRKKVLDHQLQGRMSVQQLSYLDLENVEGRNYDFVFSNFGGLNCIPDLREVVKSLPVVLRSGGWVTFVIMPQVCIWEILTVLKGNRNAFRRFNRGGVMAHLEGQYFRTWYHSLASIKEVMGKEFSFVCSEGLASLSPPPYALRFEKNYESLYKTLRSFDSVFRNHFPFNRWADHIIVTFKKR